MAMAIPVGINSRPPPGSTSPSSPARRSRPASPGCAYDGRGRSGSSRRIGTVSTTCDSATPGRRVATLRAMVPPRPPSVDLLARAMSESGLPHAVCVELARQSIADGPEAFEQSAAITRANEFARSLLGPVINATGVLLHTNLGRAPLEMHHPTAAMNIEFDLHTGERGSRQHPIGTLLAMLCGAEAAMVVNNNASAVLLVLAAIADDRQVVVSRGE